MIWRNSEGREFPATYHYAPDMPGYHSASVGKYTVCESLMRALGYELVDASPLGEPEPPQFVSAVLQHQEAEVADFLGTADHVSEEGFEVAASPFVSTHLGDAPIVDGMLQDPRLTPGKTYIVREKR